MRFPKATRETDDSTSSSYEYLMSCFPDFSYGIKSVNGVNRISGDGLEAKDVPGMLGGGGKWPGR